MNPKNLILRGKSVTLKPLEARDIERARKWVNNPELWTAMLRNRRVSVQDQKKWFHRIVSAPAKLVLAVRRNGKHIGNTGFYEIDPPNRRALYWILIGEKKERGKGYGRETARLMIRYGFKKLGLKKIYLDVAEVNRPAICMYQKLGFKKEGRFKHHYRILGKSWHVIRMALFTDEKK